MSRSTEIRARELRLLAVGLMFFVLYGGARLVIAMAPLSAGWRVAAAFLPLPAFAWFMVACFRNIGTLDELQRLIQLKALAFAFPVTVALIMTLGLLERAITLPPDDLGYRHVWMMMPMFYYLGLWFAQRRYR